MCLSALVVKTEDGDVRSTYTSKSHPFSILTKGVSILKVSFLVKASPLVLRTLVAGYSWREQLVKA